jgi:bifunctional ADP-heptose synthase (sugar kinase/adenylyltransferase)
VDTRTKILDPAAASQAAAVARRAGKSVKLATGTFDPLLAAHARWLRGIAVSGAVLFVAVREPARPLLPRAARAELVAALGMVDYVVPGDAPSIADLGADLQADEVCREESAGQRPAQDFILYVQNRQS